MAASSSSDHLPRAATDNALDLTIVIPCLNEQDYVVPSVEKAHAAAKAAGVSHEIIVIDDGSSDETSVRVEAYMKAHPEAPVVLKRNPKNRGLTRNYVDAAFMGRGKYYRLVCGDDVESLETLSKAFSMLGKADIITFYYHEVPGKPLFRRVLSNTYTWLVNKLAGRNLHYYNGLAIHLRYNIMRWGPYSFGFGFQAELITRLMDEGASLVEVAVDGSHREKTVKNSAINFGNFLSVTNTLTQIFVHRMRRHWIGR